MVKFEVIELESLRAAVPKCNVVRTRAPSYVRVHSTVDSDVLLVTAKNKSPATRNETDGRRSPTEELDLTGSPLKLNLSVSAVLEESVLDDVPAWTRDEAFHQPVSLEDARNACNRYIATTRDLDAEQCVPLWVVCGGADESRTTLLTARSNRDHFGRGVVTYEGELRLDQISFESMIDGYMQQEGVKDSEVEVTVESTLRLPSAARAALTQLHCSWPLRTLDVPLHAADVSLEQEVVVGCEQSPCHVLWRSVCALDSINRALVNSAATGHAALDLASISIRSQEWAGPQPSESARRLTRLLGAAESDTYAARGRRGGCLCVSADSSGLARCLGDMAAGGSSNDFTYQLWDILKDSETAEDMMTLLLHALKVLSSGKIKPFVIPSNRTYLARLALRLSRGHSQSRAALQQLRARPSHALALLGQLAAEKTSWELMHLFTLLDNAFALDNVLTAAQRSSETIEQINQTLHDMTMGCGDMSLNPFENKSMSESSVRLDSESFYEEEPNELSIDKFASLQKHGLVRGDRPADRDEAPLILDEIDTSRWKFTLSKFAQLFVCLEHLNTLQECLRADIASLRPVATALQQYYVSDKSPVKTVGQLLSEPAQSFVTPLLGGGGLARDHIANKMASLYRVRLRAAAGGGGTAHVFSLQPVFPPSVCPARGLDPNETSLQTAPIRYHHTKYVELCTPVLTSHPLSPNK